MGRRWNFHRSRPSSSRRSSHLRKPRKVGVQIPHYSSFCSSSLNHTVILLFVIFGPAHPVIFPRLYKNMSPEHIHSIAPSLSVNTDQSPLALIKPWLSSTSLLPHSILTLTLVDFVLSKKGVNSKQKKTKLKLLLVVSYTEWQLRYVVNHFRSVTSPICVP